MTLHRIHLLGTVQWGWVGVWSGVGKKISRIKRLLRDWTELRNVQKEICQTDSQLDAILPYAWTYETKIGSASAMFGVAVKLEPDFGSHQFAFRFAQAAAQPANLVLP